MYLNLVQHRLKLMRRGCSILQVYSLMMSTACPEPVFNWYNPSCACFQALERRRLKRMRGADDSDASDDDAAEAPAGGFAKRRFLAARAEAEPDGRARRCCPAYGHAGLCTSP